MCNNRSRQALRDGERKGNRQKRRLTDTPGPEDAEAFPHWSPDGKSILCVSFTITGHGDPSKGRVKVVDVATGATTFVVETPDIREAFWGLK